MQKILRAVTVAVVCILMGLATVANPAAAAATDNGKARTSSLADVTVDVRKSIVRASIASRCPSTMPARAFSASVRFVDLAELCTDTVFGARNSAAAEAVRASFARLGKTPVVGQWGKWTRPVKGKIRPGDLVYFVRNSQLRTGLVVAGGMVVQSSVDHKVPLQLTTLRELKGSLVKVVRVPHK